ncbi:MAG: hypothetical protein KAS32_21560 [Candidatus Peribacteraceae bacterium]|nr:hypothetical protein [Candidatus Peribacteraceae bacterium]
MNGQEKICTKCKKPKPPTEEFFYANRCTRDKLCPHCKECQKAINKARWVKKNVNSYHTRVPWDTSKTILTLLTEYNRTGIIPKWAFPCKRCGLLKPNTKHCFPYQPGSNRNEDGSRKFSTICKSCQNKARRRKTKRTYDVSGNYMTENFLTGEEIRADEEALLINPQNPYENGQYEDGSPMW